MRVIDLSQEYESLYCKCLEDWSDEMTEAGNHKCIWFEKMQKRGLRVKLALDDENRVGGMIQYLPIEESFASGEKLYFILCIWIHGHDKGRGNFQKKGMGSALLEEAERDASSLGARGMAAWGLSLPFWMKASWYKKHGYKKADRVGIQTLLWKRFCEEASKPSWIRQKKKPNQVSQKMSVTGQKVSVTAFINGWCPAQNLLYERAKRASVEFGDKVEFTEIDTANRMNFLEWGISDAVFLDGKILRNGPPLPYEKVRQKIAKRVTRLK